MYDQRWAADTGQPSQPYLDFPQFVGKDRTRFDLNTELGLVVARKFTFGFDERSLFHELSLTLASLSLRNKAVAYFSAKLFSADGPAD
jgi:hypothetical protein